MTDAHAAIIEVAIPLNLDTPFSYLVPEHLCPNIEPGRRVLVPFGRRKITGYVLGPATPTEQWELKEIVAVLDDTPLIVPREMEFFKWIAEYYHFPLGLVLKTALPSGINLQSKKNTKGIPDDAPLKGGRTVLREMIYRPIVEREQLPVKGLATDIFHFLVKEGEVALPELRNRFGNCYQQLRRLRELGLVKVEEREIYRDPFRNVTYGKDAPRILTQMQKEAFTRIIQSVTANEFMPFLLFGVTGSGKTEVYLQSIASVLDAGKNALVLVPEIVLTPQLVKRFRMRFDCPIAVLHSGLSDGERFDEWRRIRRDEVRIVIGARSAVFAPLDRIGIIVVDEEHDSSYKQSEGLRYNARDMALVRGKMERAVVVLGSATPLVTSFYAVQAGKMGCLQLSERVSAAPLPPVTLVDIRTHRGTAFSPELQEAVGATLAQKAQALLFLNRRGFASWVVCGDCGEVLRCPNCSVTLTFHRGRSQHLCHYCDYSLPAPVVCPSCSSLNVGHRGRGTERVEEEIAALFPEARVARMDRDTVAGRGGHSRVLKKLESGETDILVGTQMLAKGHDYPGVAFVGVVSADATLNMPDFMSAERTFQLITQVSGRAGRGDIPGNVVVQTLSPDHYALQCAARHDFAGFYEQEIVFRKEAGYPPFARLAFVLVSAISSELAASAADDIAVCLCGLKATLLARVEVLGPAPAPLARLRGRSRMQILLKTEARRDLHRLLAGLRRNYVPPIGVKMLIDVDPVEML